MTVEKKRPAVGGGLPSLLERCKSMCLYYKYIYIYERVQVVTGKCMHGTSITAFLLLLSPDKYPMTAANLFHNYHVYSLQLSANRGERQKYPAIMIHENSHVQYSGHFQLVKNGPGWTVLT